MSVSSASLAGKVAFVQGGSRGIGAAIVRRLAAEGASVAFTYVARRTSPGPWRPNSKAPEPASWPCMPIAPTRPRSSPPSTKRRLASDASTSWSTTPPSSPSVRWKSLPLADFERTLAINVRSVFVATQAAVKHMGDGGRVISIGSTNAERMPFAGGATYAMSKSALVGLTKGLARDLGPRGITVNNVQPGPVDTDMNPDDGDFAEALKGLMALPRYARSEEIASFVAYLAGPEAAYITGASLTIDGGFSA